MTTTTMRPSWRWSVQDKALRRSDLARGRDRAQEETIETEDRKYVVSHAGLLQRRTGLGDVVHHISKGMLIFPLILMAISVPVMVPLWMAADYLLIWLCLAHMILIATVLTVWSIAVVHLDMIKTEEGITAEPMTSPDDPRMGGQTPPIRRNISPHSEVALTDPAHRV